MSSTPGNTTTTETLSVNEVITSTIDTTTDADWFRVSLTTGLTYGFTVVGSGGPGFGMPDPDMFLYNTTGSTVLVNGSNGGSGTNSFTFSTITTGTYFIGISDNGFGDTGGYRLSWVATDNIVNNTNTTRTLGAGQTISSKIDVALDRDWIKVTMTEGLSYAFVASAGSGSDLLEDADLFIYDANGNYLPSIGNGVNGSSNVNYLSMLIEDTGTYFVEVSDNGFNDTGSYNLTWVSTDTIVNNTNTTRTLGVGQTISSKIDVRQDRDWVKVTMKEGLSYAFVASAGSGADLLEDADLFIHDANGNYLPSIGNGSNGASNINYLSMLIENTGTYFVEVSDNGFNDTGSYNLTWVTTDNVVNNSTSARTLARNSFANSAIDVRQDADWFKVSLVNGLSYGFQVSGRGTSGLPDGDLFLYDANGNFVPGTNGANGGTSVNTIGYTATSSGTYFISVSDNGFSDIGAYIIRNLGLDTTFNNTFTTLSLKDGTRTSGRIDVQGDSDWVKFRAEQGVTYQFQLTGTGATDGLDNVSLILRNASGVQIGSASVGTSGLVTFTATADGNIFLDVQGQRFTDKGAFILSVISTAPTLNGTAVADRLTGGANNTVINGFDGNDVLNGGAGNDFVIGGLGLDTLLGSDGNDTLSGGISADSLSGGSGADRINGGAGADVLRGGIGADKFVFNTGDGSDTIVDFQNGADRVEIQSGASSLAGLSIRQIGDDVRIVFGANTILIENVDRATITAADFLFT